MAENQTLAQIINRVKDNGLIRLDLSGLDTPPAEVPDEVYELVNLEELDLGTIPATYISKKIKNLSKLKSFKCHAGEFEKFPLELMEIEALKDVFLKSEALDELPLELNYWKSLNYLWLDGSKRLNKITGIPPNIEYLNIAGTALQNLPKNICKLQGLTKIVINRLGLKVLPLQLFELPNLFALFAGENELTTIPEEIAKLKKLFQLVVYENKFSQFPEAVTLLTGLRLLTFNRNSLTSISPKIAQLQNLEELDLSENEFTEVPSVINSLTSLKVLEFGNIHNFHLTLALPFNKIKIVPEWLVEMPKIEKAGFDNNPIENIPPEILKEGFEAIKNFFLSKKEADEEVFLYEAKMVVVGRGNVGKSVLTKKLTIPGYSLSKNATTKGIDILKNPFLFKMEGLEKATHFKFNVWDFGGQEKYDATHQLFITDRSLYLFLTEAREESNYSDFQFWLNTIRLFSNNSPVIVVLSKCDERRKLLPESLYKEKFENIVEFVDVSCADDFEYTIETLKSGIKKAINLLPQTQQKLSNHWVDIRNELEELSSEKDYISYARYLRICRKHGLNQRQADFLSQFLNDLGAIIHHQHDLLLKKTVFINTDWCVDGMYLVLDDNKVFNNNGRFTVEDLQNLWNEERFQNKQEELLKLMKEYNLCFELRDGSGFMAPDLLPPDKIEDFKWDETSNLQFEYVYDFMPAGLLSRFIVKSHSFIKDKLYWKYGVVLEYENTNALVEEDYIHNKIKIALRGENKKGLLSAIRMYIDEVHKDFDQANKLAFEEMVPCNCIECSQSSAPHFYKFNVLKKFTKKSVEITTCEKSVEQVKINNLINDVQINNPSNSLETDEDLQHFVLGLIDTVLKNDVTLKDGYMNFWRDVGFKTPKNEIEVQPYISNTLDNFCKVKGVNLSREVREANGSVDVVFSCTNKEARVLKVCVEIKKAHHGHIETAIKTQLPAYMKSADTSCGIYLVVWFKHENFFYPANFENEQELIDEIEKNNHGEGNIAVRVINCCKPISPSKLKN